MTVAVTQAVRAGATAVACASTGQHLRLDGGLRGAGRAAGARVRARRARSPPASSRRRSPTARARCSSTATSTPACASCARPPRPWHRSAQLDQPLADRGPEDDRLGAAAAARLGAARLDRRARRQPRQHLGLRQGAARGARARPDPAPAAGRLGAGQRREPLLPQLPRRASAGATRSRPRRSRPRSGSAIRRATSAPCGRSARRDGVVTAVADREILEAKAVVDAAGIGCEPASAAVGRRGAAAGPRGRDPPGTVRGRDPDRPRAEGPRRS